MDKIQWIVKILLNILFNKIQVGQGKGVSAKKSFDSSSCRGWSFVGWSLHRALAPESNENKDGAAVGGGEFGCKGGDWCDICGFRNELVEWGVVLWSSDPGVGDIRSNLIWWVTVYLNGILRTYGWLKTTENSLLCSSNSWPRHLWPNFEVAFYVV